MENRRGFSFIDALLVIALLAVVAAAAVPSFTSTLRYYKAETALYTALGQLRSARQSAVDRRRDHRVTFTTPRGITLDRRQGASWNRVLQIDLPEGLEFRVEGGVPTEASQTPDGLGATRAIDFNGRTDVIFRPDGSAVDVSGRPVNGIVYTAEPGNLESARAVTVFGPTGKIRPWTLRNGAWE
jgi:Tfp pilus assembly protein FimT